MLLLYSLVRNERQMRHQRLLPRDGVSAKNQCLKKSKSVGIVGTFYFLDENPLYCLYTLPEDWFFNGQCKMEDSNMVEDLSWKKVR
jgi:hypothetical protein